ncbi:MAG TPA: hypothetical protein VK662_05965, partial [Acidothermaceae bacterium]|nr:hypothetical protein [Acidothermaceae bacterium]
MMATVMLEAPPSLVALPKRGELARHSTYLTVRSLRTLWRQPAFAAATLIQPILWLLLFGQLFKSVVEIPGFTTQSGSYLEFITPGV